MCLAALFADSRIYRGAKIFQILLHGKIFFSVHTAVVKSQVKNTSNRSKLHADSSLLVSGEKRGKVRSKPALRRRYHMQIKVLFARPWRG